MRVLKLRTKKNKRNEEYFQQIVYLLKSLKMNSSLSHLFKAGHHNESPLYNCRERHRTDSVTLTLLNVKGSKAEIKITKFGFCAKITKFGLCT